MFLFCQELLLIEQEVFFSHKEEFDIVIRKLHLYPCRISIIVFTFLILSLPTTLWANTCIDNNFIIVKNDFTDRHSYSNLLSLSSGDTDTKLTHPLPPKSKATALRWSLGVTFVAVVIGGSMMLLAESGNRENHQMVYIGYGIASLGLVIGPASGHFYAQEYGKGWAGVLVRGLSIGLFTGVMIGKGIEEGLSGLDGGSGINDNSHSAQTSMWILGSIGLVSIIYDIATVGKSVESYNTKHGLTDFQISPTYFSQEKAIGVSLSLRF